MAVATLRDAPLRYAPQGEVDGLKDKHPQALSFDRARGVILPIAFGAGLLLLWQLAAMGFQMPKVILPTPADVFWALVNNARPMPGTSWRCWAERKAGPVSLSAGWYLCTRAKSSCSLW